MTERLKNLLIVLLISFSVILLLLNFGLNFDDFLFMSNDNDSNIIFQTSAILEDAVKPESIGINFSNEEHTYLTNSTEDELWRSSSEILKHIFETEGLRINSINNISNEIYNQFLDQRSVILFFEKNITALTLLNGLGIERQKEVAENFGVLNSIYISLDRDFVIISEGASNYLVTLEELDTTNLKSYVNNLEELGYNKYQKIDDYLNNGKIGYVPILESQQLENIRFHNILQTLTDDNIESIVNNFFGKEVNYLREIKEEGVQTIYVDGDKILKISEEGLISYFNPEEFKNTERNLYISLETALSFISNNLGYDSSLYLKEIKPIEVQEYPGFKIIFGKSANSYEVVLEDEEVVDYIEIDVFNDHIRRFSQLFRGENQELEEDTITVQNHDLNQVLKENIDTINSGLFPNQEQTYDLEDIKIAVDSADLVYIDNGDENPLGLGWKINITEHEFIFPIETR